MRHRLVGEDRLVAAARPGHPLTAGPLSPERYAAAEHLTVSRRGSLRDPIDDALTTHGLERRVVAAGPTAAFALRLALDTDLVVTLPEAVTRAAREELGLAALPPLPLPGYPFTCCGTSVTTTTAPTPGCETWPPKPSRHSSHHRPPRDSPSQPGPGRDGPPSR
ncbi:LysR substrate-binding domain-containing protein [Streptomyces rubradiris]|uniref:LysR substrate-binding domain-containing protein n=1 Tax=Streptomyces rubradiris TaxID=285531 RepID=UPI003F4D28B4